MDWQNRLQKYVGKGLEDSKGLRGLALKLLVLLWRKLLNGKRGMIRIIKRLWRKLLKGKRRIFRQMSYGRSVRVVTDPVVLYSDIMRDRELGVSLRGALDSEGIRASFIGGMAPWGEKIQTRSLSNYKNRIQRIRLGELLRLTLWLRQIYPRVSMLSCAFLLVRYEKAVLRALSSPKLKIIIAWHQFNPFHFVLDRYSKLAKIPVCWLESGAIPGTLCLDSLGQMGMSWPSRYPETFESIPVSNAEIGEMKDFFEHIKSAKLSNKSQRPLNQEDWAIDSSDNRKVLFLGSHDLGSQMNFGLEKPSKNCLNSSDYTLKSLSSACFGHNYDIIAKAHSLFPRERYTESGLVQEVRWLNEDVSIWDAIELADIVVTNVSGAAFLALALGKQVVVSRIHPFAKIAPVDCFSSPFDLSHILSSKKPRRINSLEVWEFAVRYAKYQPFSNIKRPKSSIFRDSDKLVEILLKDIETQEVTEGSILAQVTPSVKSPIK